MNWIQRLVAGRLLEEQEFEIKRLQNLLKENDTDAYDRSTRIAVLEGELEISTKAYEQVKSDYNALYEEHEEYVTKAQRKVSELSEEVVKLRHDKNELANKVENVVTASEAPVVKRLSTRKKKTE